jgi:CBS-domain-containing membrane protein
MDAEKVRDIMVPLEEYATVPEDATLYEAVVALEEAQERFERNRYEHRAVLVYDQRHDIIGKVSQLDLIKGLETGYRNMGDLKGVTHSGFSSEFLRSMMKKYELWQSPLDEVCGKAAHIKVKDIMAAPLEGEIVDAKSSLNEAIHMLVMGCRQSLLVLEKGSIVGILRLSDVFGEICRQIKACRV